MLLPSLIDELASYETQLRNHGGRFSDLLAAEIGVILRTRLIANEGGVPNIPTLMQASRRSLETVLKALAAAKSRRVFQDLCALKTAGKMIGFLAKHNYISPLDIIRGQHVAGVCNWTLHEQSVEGGDAALLPRDMELVTANIISLVQTFLANVPAGFAPPPELELVSGAEFGEGHIRALHALAARVFPDFVGPVDGAIARFRSNEEIFHGVFARGELACLGFQAITPIMDSEFERTLSTTISNIDDEIEESRVLRFTLPGIHCVHLSSIAVDPACRGTEIFPLLVSQFLGFLEELAFRRNILIGRISAEGITPEGIRICGKILSMHPLHTRPDDTVVFVGTMAETLRSLRPIGRSRLLSAYGIV